MSNVDNYGLILGGIKTGWDLTYLNACSKLRYGVDIKLGIFEANAQGFKEIVDLVQQKKVWNFEKEANYAEDVFHFFYI